MSRQSTLHLRRRPGEKVLIGTNPPVTVKVDTIEGGEVNLVFKASREVAIDRFEVARRKGLIEES